MLAAGEPHFPSAVWEKACSRSRAATWRARGTWVTISGVSRAAAAHATAPPPHETQAAPAKTTSNVVPTGKRLPFDKELNV
jgi:hypothetical protein